MSSSSFTTSSYVGVSSARNGGVVSCPSSHSAFVSSRRQGMHWPVHGCYSIHCRAEGNFVGSTLLTLFPAIGTSTRTRLTDSRRTTLSRKKADFPFKGRLLTSKPYRIRLKYGDLALKQVLASAASNCSVKVDQARKVASLYAAKNIYGTDSCPVILMWPYGGDLYKPELVFVLDSSLFHLCPTLLDPCSYCITVAVKVILTPAVKNVIYSKNSSFSFFYHGGMKQAFFW